jgi:hypothetical protein
MQRAHVEPRDLVVLCNICKEAPRCSAAFTAAESREIVATAARSPDDVRRADGKDCIDVALGEVVVGGAYKGEVGGSLVGAVRLAPYDFDVLPATDAA